MQYIYSVSHNYLEIYRSAEVIRNPCCSLMVAFPCLVCDKPVATNHKAVYCDLCDKWVHIYCNNICKNTYQKLKKDNNPWFCKLCLRMEVPFSSLNNTEFSRLLNGKSILPKKELKATPIIFEKLNNFTENENMACKYYSNEDFNKKLMTTSVFAH